MQVCRTWALYRAGTFFTMVDTGSSVDGALLLLACLPPERKPAWEQVHASYLASGKIGGAVHAGHHAQRLVAIRSSILVCFCMARALLRGGAGELAAVFQDCIQSCCHSVCWLFPKVLQPALLAVRTVVGWWLQLLISCSADVSGVLLAWRSRIYVALHRAAAVLLDALCCGAFATHVSKWQRGPGAVVVTDRALDC
jgi:hypothetical protein